MIWLTWRQHRRQALFTAVALAVIAAVMVPTGLAMHHTFTGSGLSACLDRLGTGTFTSANVDCHGPSQQFSNQYRGMEFIGILFVILPLLAGLFFGAPLVAREVEHGTQRLVWTQGVSRLRWAAAKFGLVGGATVVLAVLYALGVSWWFGPLAANGSGRFADLTFDVQGIAPIGYTLFALALGVFAGTVWHRMLPAMGFTLAGYVVVRVLVEALARPRYMTPKTASLPIASAGGREYNSYSGDWIQRSGVINAGGKLVLPNQGIACSGGGPGGGHDPNCGVDLVRQGLGPAPFSNWERYQPADRFWAFQAIEVGIFVALTALLLYLAVRRVRRIA